MRRSRSAVVMLIAGVALATLAACRAEPVLMQQLEARERAAALQVELTKSAESVSRAVMASSDETSAMAASEAEGATRAAVAESAVLRPLLTSLGYRDELALLDTFDAAFARYQQLDAEILPLAAESSNVKAQRLSFGLSREAADEVRTSLDGAVKAAPPAATVRIEASAARATIALLEIRTLQAPHIAEGDDAVMARMEAQMAASAAAVRTELAQMTALAPSAALTAAAAAFDRFMAANGEIVTLSRRNSNVRSLALTLGEKRTVAAQCQAQIQALVTALSKRGLRATR